MTDLSSPELMQRTPLLSILTVTYNHEPFIAECIEGAMAQTTDFPVEMVLGEDCSQDRTREICIELQRRHPDRLRLLLQENNVGPLHNFRAAWEACRGRYVAILEGDDVWTAPHKLQRQVELLEANPGWAASFHNVRLVREHGSSGALFFPREEKRVFTTADFVEKNFVPTCSCVFRNRGPSIVPDWFWDLRRNPYADWVLHAIHARHGDFGYVHEPMAAHRRHAGGSWGGTFDGSAEGDILRMKRRLVTFRRLAECMEPRFRRALRRQRALACFHLGLALRRKGERLAAIAFLIRSLATDPRAGAPAARALGATCLPMRRGEF
jgi:glycosyltransferase involved in cell wall biosynthesis